MSIIATTFIGASLLFSAPGAIHELKNDISSTPASKIVAMQSIYLSACVLANTQLDELLYNHIKTNYIDPNKNEWNAFSRRFKPLGERNLLVLYATAWATSRFFSPMHTSIKGYSQTCEHIMKSMIVGSTMCILSQQILGGNRPKTSIGSGWHIGGPDHGVSGHAFLGAVPFLVFGNLTANPYSKLIFTTLSFCTGLTRIADRAHYPSQVLLGWSIAKTAVDLTTPKKSLKYSHNTRFLPFSSPNGQGLRCSITY